MGGPKVRLRSWATLSMDNHQISGKAPGCRFLTLVASHTSSSPSLTSRVRLQRGKRRSVGLRSKFKIGPKTGITLSINGRSALNGFDLSSFGAWQTRPPPAATGVDSTEGLINRRLRLPFPQPTRIRRLD